MAPTAASGGTGTLKTLEKLEKSVQAGNYYEAQQMYKTIYARYMASKKYKEALDLLQSGASVQLRHGQFTCGIELAILLIDVFCSANIPYDESSLDRIKSIYAEVPRSNRNSKREEETGNEELASAKTRVEGVQAFLKAAIKWSAEFGGPSRGSPELHDILASYMWTEPLKPDLGKVFYHFVRGKDLAAFVSVIVEAISQSEPDVRDLVLARGVLLYLSLGNMRDANKLFEGVETRLKQSECSAVLSTPLIHFVRFLLLTLERNAAPLLRMLRENYKEAIERDPTLDDLLDIIGEKFYGARRKNGMQGMFGDFMRMLSDGSTSG